MTDPATQMHREHAHLAATFKAVAMKVADSQMALAQWHATMAVYELMRQRTGG